MRKLNNVKYTHTRKLTEEQKDELIIPEGFEGSVAIEAWNVNGKLKRKAVCITAGVCNYILGLGAFKALPFEEKKQ